jgi:hypothetical protein
VPHFFGGAADELFVGIAGAAPELVIKMGNGKVPAIFRGKRMEEMQQDHGIGAAGHGDEDFLAGQAEPVLPDGSRSALEEDFAHTVMVWFLREIGTDIFEKAEG